MSFFDAIYEWFQRHFGWLADFFQPMAEAIEKAGGELLVTAAQKAVAAVAADPGVLTDAAKRQAAFDLIATDLKAQGIEAGISVINAAIELAVQKLKAAQAQPAG